MAINPQLRNPIPNQESALGLGRRSVMDEFLYPLKDGFPTIPLKASVSLAVIGLVVFGLYRWYQDTYSLLYGLDAFEPEFQTYFMNLFWAQLGIISLMGLIALPFIWFSRPRDILAMSPIEELSKYYLVFSVLTVSSIFVVIVMALFAESDAAWHQITIRDTDFTPTHIGLFYFAMPLLIVGLLTSFLWIHTRLPDYHRRLSVPLCIVVSGPLLIMPNLGFNEWGHTFFLRRRAFRGTHSLRIRYTWMGAIRYCGIFTANVKSSSYYHANDRGGTRH